MSGRLVEIVPYDDVWPLEFLAEAKRLEDVLPSTIAIHHIGSTSVAGLAAKPIIDILLEVDDLTTLDRRCALLATLGYRAKGEFGIAGRRCFTKGERPRTHQLHAFAAGDAHVARHLAFRDYLRAHPTVAEEYANLKHGVAAACEDDIGRYCAGKHDFVQAHQTAALRWWPGVGRPKDRRSAERVPVPLNVAASARRRIPRSSCISMVPVIAVQSRSRPRSILRA